MEEVGKGSATDPPSEVLCPMTGRRNHGPIAAPFGVSFVGNRISIELPSLKSWLNDDTLGPSVRCPVARSMRDTRPQGDELPGVPVTVIAKAKGVPSSATGVSTSVVLNTAVSDQGRDPDTDGRGRGPDASPREARE